MKTRHIIKSLLACLILVFIASCGVTETGNPCPGEGCPASAEPSNIYVNSDYGVQVEYPDGWSYSEEGGAVEFTNGGSPATTALFGFERLDPQPAALLDYLNATYPGRTFIEYNTGTLSGYLYDDSSQGGGGGDLREYFFLSGDVLVHVTAEIFSSGEDEFEDLLSGISFQ